MLSLHSATGLRFLNEHALSIVIVSGYELCPLSTSGRKYFPLNTVNLEVFPAS